MSAVGLQVCYDLRFPEGARVLRSEGAQLIGYNAAWTARTGPPHWEVLLRARAIENQAYVLAPDQVSRFYRTLRRPELTVDSASDRRAPFWTSIVWSCYDHFALG